MLEEWFFHLQKNKDLKLTKAVNEMYGERKIHGELRDIYNHFKEEFRAFIESYENFDLKLTLIELADLSNMIDILYEKLYELKK